MDNITTENVTQGVKSAVNAYLMARTHAEVMREKVNKYYREALEIFPLYEDMDRRCSGKRIYSVDKMYLSKDEETCTEVYEDVNFHLRKDGIKPEDMPEDHCPACVAENLQTKTEWLIEESAAKMLKMDMTGKELNHRLLCMGLEKRQKFIDLIVGLVVNLPDFKNPLTGEKGVN